MNGVHDMGGMHGMGPIRYEENEPVFHAPWEGRVYVMNRALGAWRKWNTDASRHVKELIPPADYLRMSYYERWYAGLIELLVTRGLITRAEADSGKPAPGLAKANPPVTVDNIPALLKGGAPATMPQVAPKFRQGQRVRARNIHPTGHTRLPRYARGKQGTIVRDNGVFAFADTMAHFLGEKPHHCYSVRFLAHELWGDQAKPQDSVYLDLWDDHLEPA
ncbi:MAG: nitrile hydratase subunit beta [Acidobacteria bacterium]|nr:nitrile hydratase subunit beta [Acidobacteriota bacterium]